MAISQEPKKKIGGTDSIDFWISGLFLREYPHVIHMAKHMVQYLHLLDPGIPIDLEPVCWIIELNGPSTCYINNGENITFI